MELNAWKLILITNGLMHKLGAVLPSRHLLLLLVDPHRHAASRAKQKHLNTNNNNNNNSFKITPNKAPSLGFSTLREKFFFKLRSCFLISQEKLFCVLEKRTSIHKLLGQSFYQLASHINGFKKARKNVVELWRMFDWT